MASLRTRLLKLNRSPVTPTTPSFTPKQKQEDTIKQLRQANSSLKQELESEKSKYDRTRLKVLETHNTNLNHQLQRKNAEVRQLESEIVKLQQTLKNQNQEISELKAKLESSENKVNAVESELEFTREVD